MLQYQFNSFRSPPHPRWYVSLLFPFHAQMNFQMSICYHTSHMFKIMHTHTLSLLCGQYMKRKKILPHQKISFYRKYKNHEIWGNFFKEVQ